jgi:hypothetical protein
MTEWAVVTAPGKLAGQRGGKFPVAGRVCQGEVRGDRAAIRAVDPDGDHHDPKAMMDFLRKATYDLSPKPLRPMPGHEFEAKYRTAKRGRGRGETHGGGNFR